jgi:hypothetical protein
MKNFKIELNNPNNIRDLLQTAYRLAEEQIIQAQNEINKLSNSTTLQNEPMDGRAKYAKAINDYLSMKDKAIAKKLDIAKLLTEIYHHNGNVKEALGGGSHNTSINFDDIRKMVDDSLQTQEKEEVKTINLKK